MDSKKQKAKHETQASLPGRAGTGRSLSPAFLAQRFKPGQSGNPSGNKGTDYGDVIRLAREASPRAIQRLVELMESDDERVALLASQALLDRAYGKSRETPQLLLPAADPEAAERQSRARALMIRPLDEQVARMHLEDRKG